MNVCVLSGTCVERGRASGRDAVDLQELARPAPPHDVEAEAAGSLREARVYRVTPQITRLLCEHRHWRGAERKRERERQRESESERERERERERNGGREKQIERKREKQEEREARERERR